MFGNDAESGQEKDSVAVRLRVADESLTPLAESDRAFKMIRLLVPLGHGARARYRLNVMHAVGQDGAGRWRIRRIQALLPWMEPASVTSLVSDLAGAGLLQYDAVEGVYRLPPDVRVLIALVNALAVPEIPTRRMVRIIGQSIHLARATGAGEEVLHAQFRSAMAALAAGERELRLLLDDYSPQALREAGEALADNAQDMEAVLREHADFFAAQRETTVTSALEQSALELVGRVGGLAARVVSLLSERARTRLSLAGRIDRGDLMELTAQLGEERLAGMLSGLVASPPAIPAPDTALAFDALHKLAGQEAAAPAPLPAPAAAVRAAPPTPTDQRDELQAELRALSVRAPIAELIARVDFAHAVSTQVDLISLYALGDDGLPRPELSPDVRAVEHAGIARMSDSYLDGSDARA
jgi:hypothetical protein